MAKPICVGPDVRAEAIAVADAARTNPRVLRQGYSAALAPTLLAFLFEPEAFGFQ